LGSAEVSTQEDSKFVELVLQGIEKSSNLHFKRYNLAIYVVETFSTHYFNSPKQDPMVESQKIK
jgi:hypothetical protein